MIKTNYNSVMTKFTCIILNHWFWFYSSLHFF